jgi:hypothetical protein
MSTSSRGQANIMQYITDNLVSMTARQYWLFIQQPEQRDYAIMLAGAIRRKVQQAKFRMRIELASRRHASNKLRCQTLMNLGMRRIKIGEHIYWEA